ncbi:hypothetical protein EII94_22070, partial [Xanthomonas perforans]
MPNTGQLIGRGYSIGIPAAPVKPRKTTQSAAASDSASRCTLLHRTTRRSDQCAASACQGNLAALACHDTFEPRPTGEPAVKQVSYQRPSVTGLAMRHCHRRSSPLPGVS